MSTTEPSSLRERVFNIQQTLSGIKRNAENDYFSSRYVTLEAVWDTLRPLLKENKLVVTQEVGKIEGLANGGSFLNVKTVVMCVDTEEQNTIKASVPITKLDPQQLGSAITYVCRYTLMAYFGLPPVDDDGEDAMRREEPKDVSGDKPADAKPRSLNARIKRAVAHINENGKKVKKEDLAGLEFDLLADGREEDAKKLIDLFEEKCT